MASRNTHVQDNSVVERRLRPIYEYLDSGNNKKSLQECDKVLKKTPNLQCAKALKALTLLRMGKEKESSAILQSLSEETPTDEGTLQAMTLCCRELQQLDKICEFYEAAIKVAPTNEELHTHLFMSYVRTGNFKAQQKTANTLYKFKPKNPYYCWAVMSVVCQATRGEGQSDPRKKELLLSLAERMMVKLKSDNKMDAEQEVQLYCLILDLQGKYEEILGLLDGPLGLKLTCTNIEQMKLEYLVKLGRWTEVNLICKKILNKNIDRWNIWKEYINSVIRLLPDEKVKNHVENHVDDVSDNDIKTVDDTPEKAHEFICRLAENNYEGFQLRGPYLARFELCLRLSERNIDASDLLGDLVELFVEYFRKFGHKQCCLTDLRTYLNLLSADEKSDLAAKFIKDVGISATNIPKTEQQMQRHICALQLSRLCGSHRNLPSVHLKALVTAFTLHYEHGYQSYGKNLLSTDLGPSDPYALLAAHLLYDLAIMEESAEPIIVALILLEKVLQNSPSNFHAKLLCIKLYQTIGGSFGAYRMYCNLEPKHLQLDSLGYIHCAHIPTTGLIDISNTLYYVTTKLFSTNYRDSSDYLTSSYKFGSFHKLDDFMDFREKLNNSLHFATVTVDKAILGLVCCLSADAMYSMELPQKHDFNRESYSNNQDLSVYQCWDPERILGPPETSPEIKDWFEQNIDFLRLRSKILLAWNSALDIAKSEDGLRQTYIEPLSNILTEWEQLDSEIRKKNYQPLSQRLVTMPMPSRLHTSLDSPYINVLINLFKLLVQIAQDSSENREELSTKIKTELNSLIVNVDSRIKNTTDHLRSQKTMEYVVNSVEIICLSVLICYLIYDISKPKQGKKTRKNNASETKSKDVLQELAESIKTNLTKLDTCLHLWEPPSALNCVTSDLESLNLNDSEVKEKVYKNLSCSHSQSVSELQSVLKTKMKLLNSMC